MSLLSNNKFKEYIIFGILVFFLFTMVSVDRDHPEINWYELIFLTNYLAAALIINYLLLPRFFYKKRYLKFVLLIIVVLFTTVLIEELILEKILFNDRRAYYIELVETLFEVIPPIIIFVGYKFAWDASQKENKIEALNRIVAESELQFLNSQINPHFLFNNLNNLYAFALEESPKTPEIILELSAILRYMLYECREPLVPLHKEIEHLEHFVSLNKLQMDNSGQVNFKVDPINHSVNISPLIFIVFVENAFKHAFASQTGDIFIDISMKLESQQLVFKCKNSYSEISNTQDLSQGIGLKNVKGRLDLIYHDNYNLEINRDDQIFNLSLTIDIDND